MRPGCGLSAALLALSALTVVAATAPAPPTLPPAEREVLDRHWRRPLPPQGRAPETFSPLEGSLDPAACGTCHPAQLAEWATSRHAQAMGPGVAGQLVQLFQADPGQARQCLDCHAPLAEQSPLKPDGATPQPGFDPALQRQGVVCAACHVRAHRRFGPPRRLGVPGAADPVAAVAHGGAIRTPAFERAEFCAPCHQFPPDGFALEGQLLQNTIEEWRRSPAAARGLTCQGCHMPDRRHLWRGIHDPEMARRAVTIALKTDRSRYRPGEEVRAVLTVANTGAGHHFPTYVTPRVVVRIELVGPGARPVLGSAEERVIGRRVTLDLGRQLADTRIPAGGRLVVPYRRRLESAGLWLRARVVVEPDHFYVGFFETLLSQGAGEGAAALREALEAARRSPYLLWEQTLPLT